MKTDKLLKNNAILFCLWFVFVCGGFMLPAVSHAAVKPAGSSLEGEIKNVLSRSIKCKNITVRAVPYQNKPGEIKTLAVKLENVALGGITADYVTVLYEKPVIDSALLRKSKKFRLISFASDKTGILISKGAVEKYIAARIKRYRKKNVRVAIRFTPPYAECFFNVPASEIDPQAMEIVGKYVQGKNLEGYAALQLRAKDNVLSVIPAKVILNHFLVPAAVTGELQKISGAAEKVPVLVPLRYSVNHVSIQNNYIFLTN